VEGWSYGTGNEAYQKRSYKGVWLPENIGLLILNRENLGELLEFLTQKGVSAQCCLFCGATNLYGLNTMALLERRGSTIKEKWSR